MGEGGRHTGDALLLAPGELRRPCLAAVAEPDAGQQFVGAGRGAAAAARPRAPVGARPARAHRGAGRASASSAARRSRARASGTRRAAACPARRGRGRRRAATRQTAARSPASRRSSVDLPEPLGPRIGRRSAPRRWRASAPGAPRCCPPGSRRRGTRRGPRSLPSFPLPAAEPPPPLPGASVKPTAHRRSSPA